jgi:predicted metalloprotease with PDZ domain
LKKFFTCVLLVTSFVASIFADVDYKVRVIPASKTFAVSMQLSSAKATEVVRIPAWCPGFYFLLDYEKRLSDFVALDPKGQRLAVRKVDSRGFLVENPNQTPITVNYRMLGNDTGLGFFRTHIRSSIAFINGPGLFMFAEDRLDEKCSVEFQLPDSWDIATPMTAVGKGKFVADGYDEFVDHPFQLGKFIRRNFEVEKIPFEVIWVADPAPACNVDVETERLKKASIPAIKLFGGAPFKRYTYFVHLEVGDFNGGLEHRASNVIAVANTATIHLDDLATHEYFHAWNVKQIRPKILGPFDYRSPQRTSNLWFSEGVTDYYAKMHAYQAGFFSESQLLSSLENMIEELEMSQTAKRLTLEQVSKQTWENGGFGVDDLSYYTKGLVIGLLFDAHLRGDSDGKQSLDDLLRKCFKQFALPEPGFEEDDIRSLLKEMEPKQTPKLYDLMVRSTGAMPYELLKNLGLRLVVPGTSYLEPRYAVNSNFVVTNVANGGADEVRIGDQIISALPNESDKITVKLVRDNKPMTVTVKGKRFVAGDYRLRRNPFATKEQRQRFDEWLAGSTPK